MKVLLVGNYPADQQYSLQAFRNILAQQLQVRGVEIHLIAPELKAIRLKIARHKLNKWFGYVDKLILFPRQLRQAIEWADVVHLCEHSSAIYTRNLQFKPHLVTCHDMMGIKAALGEIPEWSIQTSGKIYQKTILNGLKQAQYVCCISKTTQRDLVRIGSISEERAPIIYNGQFYSYTPMSEYERAPLLENLGLCSGESFMMHIGHDSPTKNRLGLLRIFHALQQSERCPHVRLVMVGSPLTRELHSYVHEHRLDDLVLEMPGLDNEQIRALYSQARALIFPSLYEGFGMPIIEAQACGCPVFTSNRAPMTEVGGEAAVYFDPTQPEQAAQTILDNLSIPGRREAIIARGYANVTRFSTERMIEDYIALYRRILDEAA